MKLFRLAALFALIAFVFTTSGLAAYVHERMDHADITAQKSLDHSEQNSLPTKPTSNSGHPSHDHCPTCQSLGAISKNIVTLTVVSILVDEAPVHPDIPQIKVVGSLDVAPTPISSRGPPTC